MSLQYIDPSAVDSLRAKHPNLLMIDVRDPGDHARLHMPHSFWKIFTDRIRAERPGLFMFAESFSFDATQIAEHTWPENGAISVLDFPGREAMVKVFAGFIFAMGVFGVAPLLMVVALTGLEIVIAFLQAYVFAILTCVYLNDALHLH